MTEDLPILIPEEGRKFKPGRIWTKGGFKGMRGLGEDGRVDLHSTDLTGMSTYHVKVDPPGAILFECVCGYRRRVTSEEKHFRCEVEREYPNRKCNVLWHKDREKSGEFDDETGDAIFVDAKVEQEEERVDEETGKLRKVKVKVPKIWGEYVGEAKRRSKLERDARGEVSYEQGPQEVVGGRPNEEAALKAHLERIEERRRGGNA